MKFIERMWKIDVRAIALSREIIMAFATCIGSSCFATTALATPISHLDTVVDYLEGTMTASITKEDNTTIQVQMTTCQVTVPGNHDSVFLYQEQGLVATLDRPYRQRFLEITTENKNNENFITSFSYKPENLARWTNFCNSSDKTVSPEQLGDKVCSVTLKPYLNVYSGHTPSEGCPANVRGAVKITNQIILHQRGMDTWDRGFDASGNQVWGAEDEAYRFYKQ